MHNDAYTELDVIDAAVQNYASQIFEEMMEQRKEIGDTSRDVYFKEVLHRKLQTAFAHQLEQYPLRPIGGDKNLQLKDRIRSFLSRVYDGFLFSLQLPLGSYYTRLGHKSEKYCLLTARCQVDVFEAIYEYGEANEPFDVETYSLDDILTHIFDRMFELMDSLTELICRNITEFTPFDEALVPIKKHHCGMK